MAEILVVIPAYNEAKGVGSVVKGARQHLPVLVVDDGSMDGTSDRAAAAGAEVLAQRPNQGKGAALRAGFRWALAREFKAVITLDADGQHDPGEIPLFVEAFREREGDLIIGTRDYRLMPRLRRATNTFGRWSFSWALGQHVPDNQSGYRLLSQRMMEAVLESREEGFEFEVDMIVISVLKGFRLDWVPIRTIYAGEASHIRPLRHTVNWFRLVWQTRQRMRRQAVKRGEVG